MLTIKVPDYCYSEFSYIVHVVFHEFLGLEFSLETHDADFVGVIRSNSEAKALTFDCSFFKTISDSWLDKRSMPNSPLALWDLDKEGLQPKAKLVSNLVPILFGRPGLVIDATTVHCNVDIFGSAFFMLSRYEEAIETERDKHDRFPAYASVAYKAGFIDRPIVNEYVEILWVLLKNNWADLVRKPRSFRKLISCDVDHPFDIAGFSLRKTILRVGARLFRDNNPCLALKDATNYFFKKFNSDRSDMFAKNIEWIIKVNNSAGNKVVFNFIPMQTDPEREEPNSLSDKKIKNLISHILDSGHEVGFHPGYRTYDNATLFDKSAALFRNAIPGHYKDCSGFGGRQHYLMFDIKHTPRLWDRHNFDYDSSLAFADMSGFRCGTCYEYTMYDLTDRRQLNVKQRPLIVMEYTVIGEPYEGLGTGKAAMDRINGLKEICRKYDGDFSLLWHNSYFLNGGFKTLYLAAIS